MWTFRVPIAGVRGVVRRVVRQIRSGGLRQHLVLAILVTASPVILGVIMMLGALSAATLRSTAEQQLRTESNLAAGSIEQWDRYFTLAIQNLQGQPDIAGMIPAEQMPVIEQMKKVYDRLEIVRTTRPDGISVVRTDGSTPVSYADRDWFKACMAGAPIYRQVLVTKTGHKPAINFSTPIRDSSGKVVGVLSTVTGLDSMEEVLGLSDNDSSRLTFVVDEKGRALAHPDAETAKGLCDLSGYPPVKAALQGKAGDMAFTDAAGREWFSHANRLASGWIVISQVAKVETLARGAGIMRAAYWLAGATILLIIGLTWLIGTRLVRPIRQLTQAAGEMAAGNLNQELAEKGTDEIAVLAGSFLKMRDAIREKIGGLNREMVERKRAQEELAQLNQTLEERVEERTRQLKEAQQELMTVARSAGMAEIATSVLHNVGNVLNSVNVSVDMARNKVQQSPVDNLSRAVAMMAEHKGDLGVFLSEDERGKQIPGFLEAVTEVLSSEQKALLEEIGSLARNVEHIKQIVNVQQSHARPTALTEEVNIGALLEDAIRVNAVAMERGEIEVVLELQGGITAWTDKHVVLQILINLVSNAKHAVMDGPAGGRRLTIRSRTENLDGESWLRIDVTDTGVGIVAENLTRIFNYGFTTKKEGHGFGLHASANSARKLGGTLTVHSDGAGRGATFTLKLPLKKESVTS